MIQGQVYNKSTIGPCHHHSLPQKLTFFNFLTTASFLCMAMHGKLGKLTLVFHGLLIGYTQGDVHELRVTCSDGF
jgi:hypothetical protein